MIAPFKPDAPKSRLSIGTEATEGAEPEVESIHDLRHLSILPAQVLQPDEIIVLLLKPSLWFVVLTAWRTLAVLTVLFLIGFLLDPLGQHTGLGRSELALAYVVLCAVRLVWQFMEWLGHVYVLTDRRVITVRGFLRPTTFETQLLRIKDAHMVASKPELVFDLGTIGFTTDESSEHFVTRWRMVSRPGAVFDAVVRTLNRYRP